MIAASGLWNLYCIGLRWADLGVVCCCDEFHNVCCNLFLTEFVSFLKRWKHLRHADFPFAYLIPPTPYEGASGGVSCEGGREGN